MSEHPLGEYLRARRGQVAAETLGLPSHGRRRVPGLRREEVAAMAGVSIDYYTRLEQGRERNPSVQVLEAIGAVLGLTGDARLHLFRLASLIPGIERGGASESVSPELLRLLEMWPDNPAIVLGKAYDVLAGNRLAYALFEGFQYGPNLLLKVFLDPDARTFYPDWPEVAANSVAGFRVLYGIAPEDPRVLEVLAELTARSAEFGRIWRGHEAHGKRLERKRFQHREVGALDLQMNAFEVKAAPGQELVVYHAESGSPSADGLALLGTLAASST